MDDDTRGPLRPAFCKLLDFPEHYSWDAIYDEVERRLSQVSDVPTEQPPSAKNQSLMLLQLNGLIDEIDGVLSTEAPETIAKNWLVYIRSRIRQIVKAVAVDTNEERTTASQALHGRETRERI